MRHALLKRALFAPFLVLAASACGSGEPDGPPSAGAPVDAAAPAAPEARVAIRTAGILMVGENTLEFVPCDGGESLWLDGPLAPDLVELHAELAPGVEPFEGIFVDVVADEGPPPAVGPGASYAGALIVHQLRRAAFEGWNCGDVDAAVVVGASGTEPFWSLRVTSEGAEFATPEGRRNLAMGALEEDPEGWVLQGTDTDGSNVFVSLSAAACRDAMSGAYSHLTAEVQLGGRILRGCAHLGPESDPDADPGSG